MEWNEGFEAAWTSVVTFVPKLVGFLLVLGIGYVVARVIAKAVDAVLERTGFDRAVERGGVRRALAHSSYDPSDLVAKLVLYTLLLFVLWAAFGVFGANPVSAMIGSVVAFLPKVFVAIVIVVVASAIAAAVKDVVGGALAGLSYGRLLARAASVTILFFGVVAALQQVEVAALVTDRVLTAVLFTLAGIAIVAVGGGGIQPMRTQWEKALNRVETEVPRIREQVEATRAGFGEPYPDEPATAPSTAMSTATPGAPETAPMPGTTPDVVTTGGPASDTVVTGGPVPRLPTGGTRPPT